jgi:large subunit ribosomal protein L29
MKVGELRVLEDEELGTRLKTARRELYELRFKHAVGQLDNASQIARVRHDIARLLTVVNERVLGISTIEIPAPEVEEAAVAAPKKARPKRKEFVDEPDEASAEAGVEEEAPVAVAEPEPEPEQKPKRGRRTKAAEKE